MPQMPTLEGCVTMLIWGFQNRPEDTYRLLYQSCGEGGTRNLLRSVQAMASDSNQVNIERELARLHNEKAKNDDLDFANLPTPPAPALAVSARKGA